MASEIVILAKGGSMHHAQPLLDHFGARCIATPKWDPSAVLKERPSLVITFDEHWAELAHCVSTVARHGVATLQIMDGILEWRRTWTCPTSIESRPLNQPILSHKVACLGRVDARILESWGNVGKCEIVGSPRLDHLVEKRRPARRKAILGRPLRVLIMTAKTAGFTSVQVETVCRSLMDLKQLLAGRPDVELIWRVTQKLHQRLGVTNTIRNVLSTELHDILATVDCVITTPSTAMLESMLCGHPVALLDYHNCPHYVPAAWRITCAAQIEPVLDELRAPPLERIVYQDFCLEDSLVCHGSARARIATLIEEMLKIQRKSPKAGMPLVFPYRIIDDPAEHATWPSTAYNLEKLFPQHPVLRMRNIAELQGELEAALGTISILRRQIDAISGRFDRIPGYRLAVRVGKAVIGKS